MDFLSEINYMYVCMYFSMVIYTVSTKNYNHVYVAITLANNVGF